jgi:hypothetical protein
MKVISMPCLKCGEWLNFTVPLEAITTEAHLGVDQDKALSIIREKTENIHGWQCPGHHVELDAMANYLDFDKGEIREIDDAAGDQDKWMAKMKENYVEVLTCDEMYARKNITGFAYGEPMTNDGCTWTFQQGPDGRRYYMRLDGDKPKETSKKKSRKVNDHKRT